MHYCVMEWGCQWRVLNVQFTNLEQKRETSEEVGNDSRCADTSQTSVFNELMGCEWNESRVRELNA